MISFIPGYKCGPKSSLPVNLSDPVIFSIGHFALEARFCGLARNIRLRLPASGSVLNITTVANLPDSYS